MMKPKWDRRDVINHARALVELASKQLARLAPRLAPGTLEGLAADAAALDDSGSEVISRRNSASSECCRKEVLLRRGARLVRSIRLAIRTAHPTDTALKLRFGVGKRVRSNVRDSVSTALSLALSAAEKHPQETRAAGILDLDLQELRDTYAALNEVVETHRSRRHAAKEAALARVAIQLRLEHAIQAVVAAAFLAFRDEPEILARFESELPRRRRRRRRKAAPDEQVSTAIAAGRADDAPGVDGAAAVGESPVTTEPPRLAESPSPAALLSNASVPPLDGAGAESG